MPCKTPEVSIPHTDPKTNKKLKRSGGELVRHDTLRCPMCWNVIGCPIHFQPPSDDEDDEILLQNGQNVEVAAINRYAES